MDKNSASQFNLISIINEYYDQFEAYSGFNKKDQAILIRYCGYLIITTTLFIASSIICTIYTSSNQSVFNYNLFLIMLCCFLILIIIYEIKSLKENRLNAVYKDLSLPERKQQWLASKIPYPQHEYLNLAEETKKAIDILYQPLTNADKAIARFFEFGGSIKNIFSSVVASVLSVVIVQSFFFSKLEWIESPNLGIWLFIGIWSLLLAYFFYFIFTLCVGVVSDIQTIIIDKLDRKKSYSRRRANFFIEALIQNYSLTKEL